MLRQDIRASDGVAILRRRWILITLLTLFGGVSGYVLSRVLPKRFTSQTLVLVQQPAVSTDLVPTLISDNVNQRLAAMQQQILSGSRLEPVIQELGLYHKDINRLPMEDLVEQLRRTITITPIQPMAETRAQNLPGFTISVVFEDPHTTQQICAKITSMFLAENTQIRKGEVTNTTEFLGKQLVEAKAKLDEQDAKLAAFQRRYIGSLPDQSQTNLNLLTGLSSQLEASTQALNRAQQDKTFAESVLGQQMSAWQASQSGANPETLDQQLVTLQAQLLALQSKYTNDHPDVIKTKNDIVGLKRKIADAEQQQRNAPSERSARAAAEPAQIQQLRAQIHQYDQVIKERTAQQTEIQKQINLYQSRVQSSPSVEQEYKLLTRDHQSALDFYNELLKKHDQSSMSQGLEETEQSEHFRVLEPANYSDVPSFPKVPIFVGGGFVGGLALGLGLTLLLEMQDTSMRVERDVEMALRLPVLVSIPTIKYDTKDAKEHSSIFKPETPPASTGARA